MNEIKSTLCECCNETTIHIPIDPDALSYSPQDGFEMHLTMDELLTLRAQLGAFL